MPKVKNTKKSIRKMLKIVLEHYDAGYDIDTLANLCQRELEKDNA